MLDDRQKFKVGFISRCIEDGCTTPAEICQRAKQAADDFEAAPPHTEKAAFLSPMWDAVKSLGTLGATAALAAPPVLGGVAGYGMARAGDIDEDDVEEAKKNELIEEYRRQAAKAIRQRKIRLQTASKGRSHASLF